MTHRLLTAVTRALSPRPLGTHPDDHVHFHTGPHGQANACFDWRCDRPRLS
jgi:hypothetical protein